MSSLAYDSYLVGGSSGKSTSDALEQRLAIRQMCGYIGDDAKIARYHGVSEDLVACVRLSIKAGKRKGRERQTVSHAATGADAVNPFTTEKRMEEMLRRGSEMLRERVLDALIARVA